MHVTGIKAEESRDMEHAKNLHGVHVSHIANY